MDLFAATSFTVTGADNPVVGHRPRLETRLPRSANHQVDGVMPRTGLTWKRPIGQNQAVASYESVGYGRTWTARRLGQLAVIPSRFADGYSRPPDRRGIALIRGLSGCVVGRMCAGILTADI